MLCKYFLKGKFGDEAFAEFDLPGIPMAGSDLAMLSEEIDGLVVDVAGDLGGDVAD